MVKARTKGANKHRLKSMCGCPACREDLDERMTKFYGQFRSVIDRTALDDKKLIPPKKFLSQATELFTATRAVPRSMKGAWLKGFDRAHVPGYVLTGVVSEEGDEADFIRLHSQELWDADISDGGIGLVRRILQQDLAEAESDETRPNVAIWVPGIFNDDMPMQFLAVGLDGEAVGVVAAPPAYTTIPSTIWPALLQAYRDYVKDRIQLNLDDESPTDRMQVALTTIAQYAHEVTGDLAKVMDKVTVIDEVVRDALQKQRERLVHEADVRRKAAVGAKNQELQVMRARVTGMQQQLSQANADLGKLRKSREPAPTALAVSTATPVMEVTTPAAATEPDEAENHFRSTTELQAAVIRELRLALAYKKADESPEGAVIEAPEPRKLVDLAEWAAENADRVIVLKRAFAGAKKANYEDEELIFKALDIIAGSYRDSKLGIAERNAYKDACLKHGLDYGGSISECPGDAYFFSWRGRRLFLDQSIGRGTSRDPRYCMRIYFTWHAEEQKVIIGWLPNHLPTVIT